MSCEWSNSTVHGYFDGELDAVRATDFERHLRGCSECQASLQRIESLRRTLRQEDVYEGATSDFREQIRKQLGFVPQRAQARAMFSGRSFLIPAYAALFLALSFTIAWYVWPARSGSAAIAAELIDAHVRSLQPGHLTDVQSTDQHTVKPWFDGKVDFIPPVADYSQQGFPLLGGRLDVINAHNVSAVVYARRKHIINLFVWPARGAPEITAGSGSRQGYNWTMWQSGGMQFCLVSDASASDLRQLEELIRG